MTNNRTLLLLPVISLLLVAVALPFVLGVVPTVRFTSERIDVHVYPEEVIVDGTYFYKNPFPFPVIQGFTIPFPKDKDHPEPLDVTVEHIAPGKRAIETRRIFGHTGFEAWFSAHEETGIRVSYRQKAAGENATYILKTTRPWGRPLESGVYMLYPHDTVILSSNYAFDLPGSKPGFSRNGFMPDKDWQFTWKGAHEKHL